MPLCRHRVIRETAEGLDEPCHFTAKCEQLAHCRRWNPDAWQSPVEGLSLVKHTCQESSPGQQVIKKYLQLWNLPMDGTMHTWLLTAQSSQNSNEEGGGGFPLCYASCWHTGLLSIDQQAELCSSALLMSAQSTGIAFWCLPTGEFPVTNHILQMTNLTNERSLQVSLDNIPDSQYLEAKVQSYSRSN